MQYSPNEAIPIVYVLSDPTDTGVYYVRAVMRNSGNGAIIKYKGLNYLNLTVTAGNSRRFTGIMQAPNSDNAGLHIDITITVYTDSAYTQVSANYQERLDPHLVSLRWSQNFNGGASGWTPDKPEAFDWSPLKAIILEAFNALPNAELPELDLSPVLAQGDSIRTMIRDNKPEAPAKIDLEAHTGAILNALEKHFKSLAENPLDLSPISEQIKALPKPESIDHEAIGKTIESHLAPVHEVLETIGGMRKFLVASQAHKTAVDEFSHSIATSKEPKKPVVDEERMRNLTS